MIIKKYRDKIRERLQKKGKIQNLPPFSSKVNKGLVRFVGCVKERD